MSDNKKKVLRCSRCGVPYTLAQAKVRRRPLGPSQVATALVCDQPDSDPKSGFKKCGGFIRPAVG